MSLGKFKKKCLSLNLLGHRFELFYRKNKKINIKNNGQADEAKKYLPLFFNDIPIKRKKNDLLNRAAFVENIVEFLTHTKIKESLVVAINGEWGEGKTSVKNLIVEYIKDDESKSESEDEKIIIEISPWKWVDSKDIRMTFMKEIHFHLNRIDSSKSKKLAKRMEKYIGLLKLSNDSLNPYEHSLTLVLIFVGIFSSFLIFISGIIGDSMKEKISSFVFSGIFLCPAISLVLFLCALSYFCSSFCNKIISVLDLLFEPVSKKHSAGIYKKLIDAENDFFEELRGFDKPVILAVDEIDRLNKEQTQNLFNILKANINFPNFVYLLFYQQDIVESKFHSNEKNEKLANENIDYLEKIIQVSLNLPKASNESILKILNDGIKEIFKERNFWGSFERIKERWKNVFGFDNSYNEEKVPGISSYFKNIRVVHRFLSSLNFHIHSFVGDNAAIDVNLIDLISIEVIRLFEPEVYFQIKSNPLIFTIRESEVESMIGLDGNKIKDKLQKIIKSERRENEALNRIIIQLFPNISWCMDDVDFTDVDYSQDGYLDIRINNKECFERYFVIALSDKDVPQSEIKKFISLYDDKIKMTEYLRYLKGRKILNLYLSKFSAYTERISSDNIDELVAAIFDIGDELSEKASNELYSEIGYSLTIVKYALRKVEDEQERKRIIKNALEKTKSSIIPLIWIYTESESMRSTENDPELDYGLNDAEFESFKRIGLRIIERYKAGEELEHSNYLASILIIWHMLDEVAAKEWVGEMIKDNEGLIKFFKAFMGHFGMPAMIELYFEGISKATVENFFQIESVEIRLREISDSGNISEDEREVIEAALGAS